MYVYLFIQKNSFFDEFFCKYMDMYVYLFIQKNSYIYAYSVCLGAFMYMYA